MNDIIYSEIAEKHNTKKREKIESGLAMKCRHYALHYVEENRIVYMAGQFWRWVGTHFHLVEDPQLLLTQHFQAQKIDCGIQTLNLTLNEMKGFTAQENKTAPFWLDGAKSVRLIPFANGLLDLDTYLGGEMKLTPHTPELFITYCLPYAFDPNATCEQWLSFLNLTLDGDGDRFALLQEFFGYVVSGDISLQKLMLLLGLPRSGKGTTASVLQAVIGHENSSAFDLHRLIDRFSLAGLVNKSLAVVGEVELGSSRDRARILEKLKSITGNDPQIIERKGVDLQHSCVLPCRWLLAANSMPQFHDASGAAASRLLIINFTKTFAGSEDPQLLDKLKTELPGIANWAMVGLQRLLKSGWTKPATSVKEKDTFRRTSSAPLAFLQDCCLVRQDWLHPLLAGVEGTDDFRCSIESDLLRQAYDLWAVEELGEEDRRGFSWFVRDVRALLPHWAMGRPRINGKPQYVIFGVTLRPDTVAELKRQREKYR